MKKSSTNIFMIISILMQLLHIMRDPELSFIIGGLFPYILYYGTMALNIICLICYLFNSLKRLKKNRIKH